MKKYIIITEASSGIGKVASKEFAKRGKNLILIARRKEKLEEVKQEIVKDYPNLDIVIKAFDLTQIERLEQLFSSLEAFYIETWLNNAGVGYYSLVEKQDIKRTKQLLNLNVELLTILSILYVKKYHEMKGTQLINISSAGGYIMVPNAVTYCASKFYVSSFSEALALELRENNSSKNQKCRTEK